MSDTTAAGGVDAGGQETARLDAIFARRAQRLAQSALDVGTGHADDLELAVFRLAGARYAIEARFVHDVFPLLQVTSLPGAPPIVVGIANHRGAILAIMDIRQILGIAVRGLSDLASVVVLGRESAVFGILVDEAQELQRRAREEIASMPSGSRHVIGVCSDGLIVLDGGVVIDDPRFWPMRVRGAVRTPADREASGAVEHECHGEAER